VGTSFADSDSGTHAAESPFEVVVLVLGVLTFIPLVTTLTIGLLFHRKRPNLFSWHRRMALTTLVFAVIHLTMALIFH
jgi:hypothetical protein